MSKWIKPSELGRMGRPADSTAVIGPSNVSQARFEAKISRITEWLPNRPGNRQPLYGPTPYCLALGILACWHKGLVPDIYLNEQPKGGLDCGKFIIGAHDLSGQFHRPEKAWSQDAHALAFNGSDHGVTFGQLDADLECLERELGAWCGLNPRLGTGPIQDPIEVLLQVLWPLCLGIPLSSLTMSSIREIAKVSKKQPVVICGTPAWLNALRGSDFEQLPHPFETALIISAKEKTEVEFPDWAKQFTRPVAQVSGGARMPLTIDPVSSRKPDISQVTAEEGELYFQLKAPHNTVYVEGHFPESPILPGIAQLHWIFELLKDHLDPQQRLGHIEAVKFHKVLFAEEICEIHLKHDVERNKWRFQVTSDRGKIASGRFALCAATGVV